MRIGRRPGRPQGVRVGRFINAAGTTGFPTGKRAVSATQLMWVSSLIRHPRLYTLCFRLVCCVELWADNNFTQETAMTMITPSYLGETIEYSSLHACRSTLEDPRHGWWELCCRWTSWWFWTFALPRNGLRCREDAWSDPSTQQKFDLFNKAAVPSSQRNALPVLQPINQFWLEKLIEHQMKLQFIHIRIINTIFLKKPFL